MKWFKKLYIKTKEVAAVYTGIFIVVMFLNQLLFFGLCLNPICLIAAMPHVLFITVALGTWWYMPSWKRLKKKLLFQPEPYKETEAKVKSYQEDDSSSLFTGNIHLFVTQNKSKGEEDFKAIIKRFMKPNIVSVIRLDNRNKSKALLVAIQQSKHLFKAGDIVAIVRGGGDTSEAQFDSYKDYDTCQEVRNLRNTHGVVFVSGIGHATDSFLIEEYVNFAQITPTDAALQAAYLINGGKW